MDQTGHMSQNLVNSITFGYLVLLPEQNWPYYHVAKVVGPIPVRRLDLFNIGTDVQGKILSVTIQT